MATEPTNARLSWGLSPLVYDGTRTPEKTVLFLVLCVAWILPGLVGHDPWKDEAVLFGIVHGMLASGDWIAFTVAGEPAIDKAPLFPWVSAVMAKVLGGLLPLQDAARLASGAFMAATLGFLTLASKELMGERALRMGVLLLLGCVGLLIRAHEMSTDLAGLTGVAMALWGLALAHRLPWRGGAVAGAGAGLAFLGDGMLPLGMIAGAMAALPLASRLWRTRAYAATAAMALACAVPLVALWRAILAGVRPELLAPWWQSALALPPRDEFFSGGYFLRILPWYAWPAWPLAAWTLYRARRDLGSRRPLLMPAVVLAAFFVVLAAFGEAREINTLPLLLPLALLGVAELESVPRGAASALDWFGMTTFFLFAALVWVGWIAAMTGQPEIMLARLQREVPDFVYRFRPAAVALAALLTLIWVVVIARSLRSTRRAVVNWTAGITMAWMLVMTLGVPLVDQARSYRGLAARLAAAVPEGTPCIARVGLGDPQRALLDYFAAVRTVPVESAAGSQCPVRLVQSAPSRLGEPEPGWVEIWRGARPGDRQELLALYRRSDNRASTISTQ
jgi:4-amino-4-deoxy-L-arabinose transferase-like glycosyltransferase